MPIDAFLHQVSQSQLKALERVLRQQAGTVGRREHLAQQRRRATCPDAERTAALARRLLGRHPRDHLHWVPLGLVDLSSGAIKV
jgi:hypothetical protein